MANYCSNIIEISLLDDVKDEYADVILGEITKKLTKMQESSYGLIGFFDGEANLFEKIDDNYLLRTFGTTRFYDSSFSLEKNLFHILFEVETSWSPLNDFGTTLTSLYPGVSYNVKAYEPGNLIICEYTYEYGTLVSQNDFDYDSKEGFVFLLDNEFEDLNYLIYDNLNSAHYENLKLLEHIIDTTDYPVDAESIDELRNKLNSF